LLGNARVAAIQEMQANSSHVEKVSIGVAVTIGLLGLIVTLLIARAIGKPILLVTKVMAAMTGGNHDVALPSGERRDEIGRMIKALGVFKQQAGQLEVLRVEQERSRQSAQAQRKAELEALALSFETAVGSIASKVAATSTELSSTAELLAGS